LIQADWLLFLCLLYSLAKYWVSCLSKVF